MEDNIIVTEDSEYGPKETLSIKEIALRHIKKMSDLSCQELTPSYWQTKPVKVGDGIMMSQIYHPDLREAYCNSVEFLLDLVVPYSDDQFKTKLSEIKLMEDTKFTEAQSNGKSQDEWVKEKLKIRKIIQAEIFLMFERTDFFGGEESFTDPGIR